MELIALTVVRSAVMGRPCEKANKSIISWFKLNQLSCFLKFEGFWIMKQEGIEGIILSWMQKG